MNRKSDKLVFGKLAEPRCVTRIEEGGFGPFIKTKQTAGCKAVVIVKTLPSSLSSSSTNALFAVTRLVFVLALR
jgi:hypothetical protein